MTAQCGQWSSYQARGSLFYSGTGAIVMGEKAADDAGRWLDAVARSKELRLDTELYVLKHGQAEELIAGDDAPEDVFADLSSLAKLVREDGPSPVPTCADVSRACCPPARRSRPQSNRLRAPTASSRRYPPAYAILTGSGSRRLAQWGRKRWAPELFYGRPGDKRSRIGRRHNRRARRRGMSRSTLVGAKTAGLRV